MEWTGSTKAAFCLVAFLQLSCHLWMVNATPLVICVDQDLSITADSNLKLFIDGVEVTDLQYPTSPGDADTTPLRASAQVVAVSGQNEVVYGGFLGSSGTFVTDASWKCTDQFHSGWEGVGFDDSMWQQAYEVRVHGDSPWHRVNGIRRDARWIWIKPEGCIQEGIVTVYCRKNLAGTCISTPPSTTTTTPNPTTTPTITTTPSPTTPTTPTTTTTPRPTRPTTPTTTRTPRPTRTTTPTTTTTPSPTRPTTPTTTITPSPTTPTTPTTTTTPRPTRPTTPTTTRTPRPTRPTTPTTTTTPSPTRPTTPTTTTTPRPTRPTTPTTTRTPRPTRPTTPTTTTTPSPTRPTTPTTTTTPRPIATPTTTTTAIPTTTAIQCPTAAPTDSPPACENQPPTAAAGSSCSGTGPNCITSCTNRPDGYYQSCKGCEIYASCTNQILTDGHECPACLYWDDNVKRCEYSTTTCTECQAKLCSGTGAACIGSCRRRADGDYQSCKGWDVYATCFNGRLFDDRSCAAGSL